MEDEFIHADIRRREKAKGSSSRKVTRRPVAERLLVRFPLPAELSLVRSRISERSNLVEAMSRHMSQLVGE